jgi:hypothetical protein
VSEQYLDDANVDLLLEQVSGEGVTQAVHRDRLIDSRRHGGSMDRTVELPRGHRIGRIQAGEQPAVWQDLPSAWATRHQIRSRSISTGESMA